MKKFFAGFVTNKKAILLLILIVALAASIQSLLLKNKSYFEGGPVYKHYNNYVIFKQSYQHLIQDKDLYIHYPDEQWDLYKYSPTFALLFGIFANLPDALGLSLWNILNAVILLYSIWYLPHLSNKIKGLMAITFIIELLTSMQNQQSNALIAGLIILALGLLEREQYFLAILCIVLTVYIKIFGIVAFAMCIFYPKKWKMILYSILCFVALFLLPLVVVNISQLQFLYNSWKNLLANDHSASDGLSVLGWFSTWFNLQLNKNMVVVVGALLFCIPLIKIKEYKNYIFRLLFLSSILIWIVIFNHKAESPTFIIAMSGVVIWFYSQPLKTENLLLFILAILFTSLSPTDLFPKFIRNEWVKPYVLKAVPCILIWGKIILDMMLGKVQLQEVEKNAMASE